MCQLPLKLTGYLTVVLFQQNCMKNKYVKRERHGRLGQIDRNCVTVNFSRNVVASIDLRLKQTVILVQQTCIMYRSLLGLYYSALHIVKAYIYRLLVFDHSLKCNQVDRLPINTSQVACGGQGCQVLYI